MRMTIRRSLALVSIALLLPLTACGAPDGVPAREVVAHAHPPGTGAHTHGELGSAGKGNVKPVLASSELVVGPNRFVFGLENARTRGPIKDAPQVDVQFFKVHPDGKATKVGDAKALYQGENLPVGVFITRATFEEAGEWGALLTMRPEGAEPFSVQLDFEVKADSPVPSVGEPAPPSRNLTKADVKNLSEISSAQPPAAMHDLTIAEAVRSGKPSLILFATPGFCETATCGPDLQVAQSLQERYGDRANFIHIETPSSEAAPQAQKPTMEEWKLETEPWLFLIDRDGKIAERFEGGLTLAEVEPAFEKLVR